MRRIPWWLEFALRTLPRAFRREWETDLRDTLASRWEAAAGSRRWLLGWRELTSLLGAAIAARSVRPEGVNAMYFEPDDHRPIRIATAIALSAHILAFTIVFPSLGDSLDDHRERDVIVLRTWSLPPPPERAAQVRTVQRRVRPVPIPDPTPDDPEPAVEAIYEFTAPDAELPEHEFVVTAPARAPEPPPEALRLGVDFSRPRLLHRFEPRYPELALRARKQCFVVLEARIDRDGNVVDLEVVKPCGLGLDEAAVEAVSRWKYAPTLVDGRPVEVVLSVRVNFRLEGRSE